MSASEESQNDLNEFADALRSLVPLPSSVSRDELMFRAGQASVEQTTRSRRSHRWAWPMTTAACALLAAMIGMKVGQTHSELNEQLVQRGVPAVSPIDVDVATPLATASRQPATAYLAQRNQILARGVDSLPAAGANHDAPPSDPSYLELRDGLLQRDRS